MTQNDKVKRYILDHGFITTWDAFYQLQITRLSARIYEIEHEGVHFGRVWQEKDGMRWVEYHLPQTERKRAKEVWYGREKNGGEVNS